MAKKKKKSKYEQTYKKERRRIQSFLRSARKRGYLFKEDVLPKIPKTITEASVRRLKKLTPKELYKKAEYVSEETYGEIVSASKGRQLERKKSAEKAKRTRENKTSDDSFFARVIISNWYASLEVLRDGQAYEILKSWMDKILDTYGNQKTAEMLQEGASRGLILTWEVVYKYDYATIYMNEMLDYLPFDNVQYEGETLTKEEFNRKLTEELEKYEDWSEPI